MIWTLLFFVAAIYLIYRAFVFHLFAGIGAIAAVLAYLYFRWYTNFCIAKARAVYRETPEKALQWFAKGYKHGMNIGQMEVYAYYLLREGQVELAEEIYKKLLIQRLRPELRLKIRSDYAVLLMKTGRVDEAVEELEEITVNYINTTTYGTLGYLYLLKNNRRKAESFNKEAYDYNDTDPVILDNLTELYIKMGKYEEAKKYADKMIDLKPYFVEGYYDAAYVYMKLGDFEKAEALLEEGKKCRITFMSTVTEEELAKLEAAVLSRNGNCPHKLGSFSSVQEPKAELEVPEYYADEDEPIIEYEDVPDLEVDENDPFI